MYEQSKKPGSPGDILEHHGVKGMKWGDRNEDDVVGSGLAKAQKNETEKSKMAKDLTSGKLQKKEEPKSHSGLTSNQKKALIGAGVGVVAIGGFVAYKHYAGGSTSKELEKLTMHGNPFPGKPDMSGLKTSRLSQNPLGSLGKEGQYALKHPEQLTLDISRGYADFIPKDGFANEHVKERHDSIVRALEEMREKYPAIRNMNVEIAPMSQGGKADAIGSARALGDGEARIFYNDVHGKFPNLNPGFTPGGDHPDHLGTHEMGHVLAQAHGELLSSTKIAELPRSRYGVHELHHDVSEAEDKFHKDLFEKHGLTFREIARLGEYASTSPVEGLAELSANYHTPDLRSRLTPEQLIKAKALFDDMGGVS